MKPDTIKFDYKGLVKNSHPYKYKYIFILDKQLLVLGKL